MIARSITLLLSITNAEKTPFVQQLRKVTVTWQRQNGWHGNITMGGLNKNPTCSSTCGTVTGTHSGCQSHRPWRWADWCAEEEKPLQTSRGKLAPQHSPCSCSASDNNQKSGAGNHTPRGQALNSGLLHCSQEKILWERHQAQQALPGLRLCEEQTEPNASEECRCSWKAGTDTSPSQTVLPQKPGSVHQRHKQTSQFHFYKSGIITLQRPKLNFREQHDIITITIITITII